MILSVLEFFSAYNIVALILYKCVYIGLGVFIYVNYAWGRRRTSVDLDPKARILKAGIAIPRNSYSGE